VEVLPLVALGFIDLFDYTTSMSASVVSIDNVCAERLSTLVLQRYEYCRYSITLQLHRIDHGKVSRKKNIFCCKPQHARRLGFTVNLEDNDDEAGLS
jgi:hypothetical protein